MGAPARAQAKPSTDGPRGAAQRTGAGDDANGNRLTVVKPSGTTTATYDAQDRLLTFGPWAYTYTPNGELLTKSNSTTGQSWAYAYDVFGNLKRVDLPTGDVIEYVIDGQNRRVGKKRNGTLVKQWLYGDQLHPVAELNGSGALVSRFVWASKSKNTPDLVVSGGVTYRVFTDQLGSPRVLVNVGTGAVAATMRHDAWGVVLEDSVSALMPFGFAGGLYDPETGLVRFGARDYDPSVGRWVNKDPIGFRALGSNLYAYTPNDPVDHLDRTGHDEYEPTALEMARVLACVYLGLFCGDAAPPIDGGPVYGPGHHDRGNSGTPPVLPPANDNGDDDPENNDCQGQLEKCLGNKRQPPSNCPVYGPYKDCGACYRECNKPGGTWPFYKCPG